MNNDNDKDVFEKYLSGFLNGQYTKDFAINGHCIDFYMPSMGIAIIFIEDDQNPTFLLDFLKDSSRKVVIVNADNPGKGLSDIQAMIQKIYWSDVMGLT